MTELHYVCIGGCGKVSQTQDKCNSIGCWRARNPLAECDCSDGKHTEFFIMYTPTHTTAPTDEQTTDETTPRKTDTISD